MATLTNPKTTASITPLPDTEIKVANDGLPLIVEIAQRTGNITDLFDDTDLAALGMRVVEDYNRDCGDRSEWERIAKEAIERAAQEEKQEYNWPFDKAPGASLPILASAAMQFNARAYPAICKPGEMVKVKVIGSDKGRPQVAETPQGLVPLYVGPDGQPTPH